MAEHDLLLVLAAAVRDETEARDLLASAQGEADRAEGAVRVAMQELDRYQQRRLAALREVREA
jgi:hypothetical protein